jgi:hypothetical protein
MTAGVAMRINRAPVLTLWATVVAERLGFDHDEALTLGRALAGLNAYSKGRSLGLFKPSAETVARKRAEHAVAGQFEIDLMHRAIPAVATAQGIRALSKGKPTSPESVEKYLAGKFGGELEAFTRAMAELAMAFPPEDLAARAFHLYERFRPAIPRGEEGWGAAGELTTAAILACRE